MSFLEKLWEMLKVFFLSSVISVRMTWSEFRRRASTYVVGVLTVVIVVFMVATILLGLAKSPVIFMKLAEEQTGEMDMLFVRNNVRSGSLPFLNFTDADEVTKDILNGTSLEGLVPRWFVTAEAKKKWPKNDKEKNESVGVTILVVDTRKEDAIHLGRQWNHRRIGESECHVKDTVLSLLNIEPDSGEHIILDISIDRFLSDQGITSTELFSIFGGNGNTINASSGSLIDALGLSDSDQLSVNVTAVTDTLNNLLNTSFSVGNGSDVQNVTVGDIRDALPGVLANNTINGSSLTISDLFLGGIRLDLDVADSIGSASGKYPNAVGNAVVIDSTYFVNTILEQLCYGTQRDLLSRVGVDIPDIQTLVDRFPIDDIALTMVALFKGRQHTYTLAKPAMDVSVVKKSDDIMRSLGVEYNATVSFPLATAMQGFYFLRLFLEQIFTAVAITLTVLGCILIYALLMSNVQEKTFEHGMLRALGFRKASLINLITIQALSFTIPGVATAMLLAFIANVVIENIISNFSGFPPDYGSMPTTSIVIPILVGVLVPLLANILPIQRAMGKTLRGALDVSHQSHTDTEVTVKKLQDLGLELWQTLLAIFLVVAGFLVYYMMPYSFIFNNLPLFFFLLLIILMGMLFGLCMISGSLQSFLEYTVLKCILWGKDRILETLILKNLSGHRSRSSKTYMMFTISTASIIFGGVVFTLQATSIHANIEVMVGTDIQVLSTDFDHPVERDNIDPFMTRHRNEYKVIDDWGYATFALNDYDQFKTTGVSNLLFFPSAKQRPTGIDGNLMNVIYDKYFMPVDTQSGIAKEDIISSLYTMETPGSGYVPVSMASGVPPGQHVPDLATKYDDVIEVIVSAGSKSFMSLRSDNAMKLEVSYKETRSASDTLEADYLAVPRSLISKMPGYPFVISSYTFGLGSAPIMMSIPRFKQIVVDNTKPAWLKNDTRKGIDFTQVYYEKMFIRLRPGITKFERDAFVNELKSYLSREYHIVMNTADLKDTTTMAINMLMTCFYAISGIAVALNLFLLWMSFSTNVKQSAWSFAVMRSLGFTVEQLIHAYVYEALCTVLSAFFCGSVIGLIIAITLTVQFNMFVEMPMNFTFPYLLFIIIFLEALFTSIVGSYWPATALREKQIAQVLKSQ